MGEQETRRTPNKLYDTHCTACRESSLRCYIRSGWCCSECSGPRHREAVAALYESEYSGPPSDDQSVCFGEHAPNCDCVYDDSETCECGEEVCPSCGAVADGEDIHFQSRTRRPFVRRHPDVPSHEDMRKAAMMPGRAQEFGEWWKAYALHLESGGDPLPSAANQTLSSYGDKSE